MIAKTILEAYQRTRGVGHTTVAVKVAEEFGAILVVHTWRYARQLAGAQCEIISVHHLDECILGKDKPLILDNAVIMELAREAIEARSSLVECWEKLGQLRLWNARLEGEAARVQDQAARFAQYPNWWKWIGQRLITLRRKLTWR